MTIGELEERVLRATYRPDGFPLRRNTAEAIAGRAQLDARTTGGVLENLRARPGERFPLREETAGAPPFWVLLEEVEGVLGRPIA